jgi:hypothetical protein
MFAKGRYALGLCDRCGRKYLLSELKDEVVHGKPRNVRVCSDCWDDDHPQLWSGDFDFADPQGLRDPRPDVNVAASRGYFARFEVVSAPMTLQFGIVTVTT